MVKHIVFRFIAGLSCWLPLPGLLSLHIRPALYMEWEQIYRFQPPVLLLHPTLFMGCPSVIIGGSLGLGSLAA